MNLEEEIGLAGENLVRIGEGMKSISVDSLNGELLDVLSGYQELAAGWYSFVVPRANQFYRSLHGAKKVRAVREMFSSVDNTDCWGKDKMGWLCIFDIIRTGEPADATEPLQQKDCYTLGYALRALVELTRG